MLSFIKIPARHKQIKSLMKKKKYVCVLCSLVLVTVLNMLKTIIRQARKHPGLIPQFFFIAMGMGGALLYLGRLARGPHVSWDRKNNPEPWNQLSPTYQHKLVAVNTDYKSLKKEGPDF